MVIYTEEVRRDVDDMMKRVPEQSDELQNDGKYIPSIP